MARATNYEHPLFLTSDLIGIRRTTMAKVLGVSPAAISFWSSGRSPLPERHISELLILINHGLSAARVVHKKAARKKNSPQIAAAVEVYGARLCRADEILSELDNGRA